MADSIRWIEMKATALHDAVWQNNLETAKMLIEGGKAGYQGKGWPDSTRDGESQRPEGNCGFDRAEDKVRKIKKTAVRKAVQLKGARF